MIIILLYWFFLFLIALPAGVAVSKLLKAETGNMSLLLIYGLFFLSVGFTFTALFFPLNMASLLFWIALSGIAALTYNQSIREVIIDTLVKLKALPLFYKTTLVILIFAACLKSTQFPFVIDNESYYIQTIKWLNEYGLVKGLANLHVFFAQASSWHVLQAGLNFSFITGRINDLNGFVFTISLFYYFTESYTSTSKYKENWIGLIPIFSFLLFFFIDSPSPDLPLLMLTPILLHLFLSKSDENFRAAAVLFIFMVFIKITIAPVGLLFMYYFYKKPKTIIFFTLLACGAGLLWMAKNTIISGYPFYPFAFLKTGYDWTIPSDIINYFDNIGTKDVYGVINGTSFLDKLYSWFFINGLTGIFNKLIVLLFIIVPFFKVVRGNLKYKIVYATLLLHFILLLFASPQFRFFLPTIIFFSVIILYEIIHFIKKPELFYKATLVTSCIAACIVLFSVNTRTLTDNKFHQATQGFRLSQLYMPEKCSKFPDMKFKAVHTGNLLYYSPDYNFFFYGTANGPLPCVNKVQLEHLKKKLGIVPQLRGASVKEGFYSTTADTIK